MGTEVLDKAKSLLRDRYSQYLLVGIDGEEIHFDFSSAVVAEGMCQYVSKVIHMDWEDNWISGDDNEDDG